MWRVTGDDTGQWVEGDEAGSFTADPESEARLIAAAGKPVELAPNSGLYLPTGPTDPVGVYLLARRVVGTPHRVHGLPPAVPDPPPLPADAVA